MSKIRLLSDEVCNRIAAGEVVERPASVVKELIENSLDAGASKIVVEADQGGRKCIRVVDDGEGMDRDDALLCLDPHATSKIFKEEDIFSISTFGFRGEAMPSIASVSRMTIRTRRRDEEEGSEVFVDGGKAISIKPVGCPPGTEILVRDLFHNVPARRSFLRSVATEERHITEIVTNISLAHPDVAFVLKLNGRILISSPANTSLTPRIRELFGKEYASAMLPLSRTEHGVSVNGFIAKRSYLKASRAEQRTFVNGRPVESPAIYRAIKEACGPMIERGRCLPAILFLAMPPGTVDVNVHPAKREMRFRQEFEVVAAVRSAVSAALRLNDPVVPPTPDSMLDPELIDNKLIPSFSPDRVESAAAAPNPNSAPGFPGFAAPREPKSLDEILQSAFVQYRILGPDAESLRNAVCGGDPRSASDPVAEQGNLALPADSDSSEPSSEPAPDFRLTSDDVPVAEFGSQGLRLLGILEHSYIVGAIPGGLVLIDQHAAHERVLFERILNGVDGSLSQKLLIPITLELSRSDMAFLSHNQSRFEAVGFEFEHFGRNTIKLNAIPAALPQDNAGGFFSDLLARIAEEGSAQRLATDSIARAACKAAIKAHDKISLAEAESLLHQMSQCALPYSCPHGRPTMLNISLSEIEKRFGRK